MLTLSSPAGNGPGRTIGRSRSYQGSFTNQVTRIAYLIGIIRPATSDCQDAPGQPTSNPNLLPFQLPLWSLSCAAGALGVDFISKICRRVFT